KVAGNAQRAKPPPLIQERCLRTVLISWIAAPQASNRRLTVSLSSRERPAAGLTSRLEGPPGKQKQKRSEGSLRASSAARCSAPATLPEPGGGGSTRASGLRA